MNPEGQEIILMKVSGENTRYVDYVKVFMKTNNDWKQVESDSKLPLSD